MILPIDELIFFKMVKTTNQLIILGYQQVEGSEDTKVLAQVQLCIYGSLDVLPFLAQLSGCLSTCHDRSDKRH